MADGGAKKLSTFKTKLENRRLRAVVWLSGIYDCVLGVTMLFFQSATTRLFGIEPPLYPINGNLNGLFALSVGIGYFAIRNEPEKHLWYIWIMGVFLKAFGPALFVFDSVTRNSPKSFLLFAIFDGCLCLLSLWALRGYAKETTAD